MTRTEGQAAARVLVVDDEPTIVFAIKRYFQARGLEADGATSKDEAVALLARGGYGAVIVDLRLEGPGDTQGLEIVERARACCPDAKVVLLTAYGSPSLEEEARRRGAQAVLRKPMPLPELEAILARLPHPQRPD